MILKLKVLLSPFIYLFLIFNIPPAQAVDLCIEGKKQLSRDYQLMQINGGLLALMIQTDSLKNSADRKSTRLNSSHALISYAVFCLKKKKKKKI